MRRQSVAQTFQVGWHRQVIGPLQITGHEPRPELLDRNVSRNRTTGQLAAPELRIVTKARRHGEARPNGDFVLSIEREDVDVPIFHRAAAGSDGEGRRVRARNARNR